MPRTWAIDLSLTSPSASSLCERATCVLSTANARIASKCTKHNALCCANDMCFVPCILETTGSMPASSLQLMSYIADASQATHQTVPLTKHQLACRLTTALMRGNSKFIRQGVGRAVCKHCPVPNAIQPCFVGHQPPRNL
jgi:hypothetical protein